MIIFVFSQKKRVAHDLSYPFLIDSLFSKKADTGFGFNRPREFMFQRKFWFLRRLELTF